jgi:hypothetical protein
MLCINPPRSYESHWFLCPFRFSVECLQCRRLHPYLLIHRWLPQKTLSMYAIQPWGQRLELLWAPGIVCILDLWNKAITKKRSLSVVFAVNYPFSFLILLIWVFSLLILLGVCQSCLFFQRTSFLVHWFFVWSFWSLFH